MIQVNAMGDTCPIPVVKTKNAIKELHGSGVVEVLVDNEIAVQNLCKMAAQKGYDVKSEKMAAQKFKVMLTIGEVSSEEETDVTPEEVQEEYGSPDVRTGTLVVIASSQMGVGDAELGEVLLKGFFYALTQQEDLPGAILFYNGGAALTCEGSPILEDLKFLEANGVELLTCGTCLNYYGLTERLEVGEVTNMYVIVEKMTRADRIVKP